MKNKNFYFEMTDTFGGELNYCWLQRFVVDAKSIRGALQKLSRETGLNFRNDGLVYRAKNSCVAVYELDYEVDRDWLEKAKGL